jgi:NADH-quinone oxidoreductase subunit N
MDFLITKLHIFNWFDVFFIIPEFIIIIFICTILIFFSTTINDSDKKYTPLLSLSNHLSIFGLVLIFISLQYFVIVENVFYIFNNSIIVSPFTLLLKKLIIISTLLILENSNDFLEERHNNFCEFYLLIFCMLFGSFITISANDFLIMYLGLEIQALSGYVLTCLGNTSISAETGLRYILIGSFASAFMLFGMSLIVYVLGTHNFSQISINLLILTKSEPLLLNFLLFFGIFFLFIGFCIKLGVAPFHFWLADVYEGALIPVALYLATVQKMVNLLIFAKLFVLVFHDLFDTIQILLMIFAILSIIYGFFQCLFETKIKRFLAFSSVSHMGFLLLSLSLGGENSLIYFSFYFFIYYIKTFIAWKSFMNTGIYNNEGKFIVFQPLNTIRDLMVLIKQTPIKGIIVSINFLSMGGIPPLLGFPAKVMILNEVILNLTLNQSLFFLDNTVFLSALSIFLIGNVCATYYYVRFLQESYYLEKDTFFYLPTTKYWGNFFLVSSLFFNVLGTFFFFKFLKTITFVVSTFV